VADVDLSAALSRGGEMAEDFAERQSQGQRSARKKAIVAVARQLAVDLWRWQTGRATPEQLGWEMAA
jgi:hypothetical protein